MDDLIAEAAQPDNSGGSMLALYPPPELAEALAVDGGLLVKEMHVTGVYTGAAADVDAEALNDIARVLARRPPVKAVISGSARFTGGAQDVAVALVDSAALEDLRRDAMAMLTAAGITVPRDHGYTSHLTIQYVNSADPDPVGRLAASPVTFTAISAVHGGTRTDYPFTTPAPVSLAGEARRAFASGWALSDGPMTPRVMTACGAAVAEALARPDDPEVLEVTAKLGHLEGTRALIAGRREKLLATLLAAILKAWNECLAELDLDRLVARYRADVYLTKTSAPPADPAAYRDWWRDAAAAAALGFLNGIHRAKGYQALILAIENAIRSGMAEGEADALAVAAAQQGIAGLDIDAAFTAAYARLEHDPSLPTRVLDALVKMIDGTASDIARTLARLTADGATEDQMRQETEDTATGDHVRSVTAWGQWALWAAIGTAILSLYNRTGTADGSALLIDWICEGGNPCAQCLDNQAGSPYEQADVPAFPGHPNCVIGSTRVAVPDGVVMPGDVPHGDSRYAAVEGASRIGDSGSLTAPAMTEAVRDFGRRNVRAVVDREYVGEIVTIRTALGYELTATPNHPVATRGGWVPIAELKVGDHVLSSTASEWEPTAVNPDVDDIPPRIEQVAESFPVLLGPVPTAAEDFHGDGTGSDVYVVRADRLLGDDWPPGRPEHVREHQLSRRGVTPLGSAALDAESLGSEKLGSLLHAPDGVMGRLGLPGTFLGGGPPSPDVCTLTGIARLDTLLEKPSADSSPVGAERFGESELALSSVVPADHLGLVDSDAGTAGPDPFRHVRLGESLPDRLNANSVGFCDFLEKFTSGIAADQVISVSRDGFTGHVYNLETVDGWYISNGIVTHNCQCDLYTSSPLPGSVFDGLLGLALPTPPARAAELDGGRRPAVTLSRPLTRADDERVPNRAEYPLGHVEADRYTAGQHLADVLGADTETPA